MQTEGEGQFTLDWIKEENQMLLLSTGLLDII